MAPEDYSGTDHSSDVARIESDDDANNALASGAPQQTVVNGWTAINYQALLSEQMDEASVPAARDDRPVAMLGLCVAGIALIALTSMDGASPRRRELAFYPGAPQG